MKLPLFFTDSFFALSYTRRCYTQILKKPRSPNCKTLSRFDRVAKSDVFTLGYIGLGELNLDGKLFRFSIEQLSVTRMLQVT